MPHDLMSHLLHLSFQSRTTLAKDPGSLGHMSASLHESVSSLLARDYITHFHYGWMQMCHSPLPSIKQGSRKRQTALLYIVRYGMIRSSTRELFVTSCSDGSEPLDLAGDFEGIAHRASAFSISLAVGRHQFSFRHLDIV